MQKNNLLILVSTLVLSINLVYANEKKAPKKAIRKYTEEKNEVKKAQDTSEWRHSGSFIYLYSGSVSYPDMDLDAGAISSQFNYDSGFGVSYEYRKITKYAWGMAAGFEWHSERELASGTVDTIFGSGDVNVGSSPASLSAKVLYFSWIYTWSQFYMPMGFNWSSIDISQGDTFSSAPEAKGGMGVQLGFGWTINNNFSVELISRALGHRLEVGTANYGLGFFGTASLGVRYTL